MVRVHKVSSRMAGDRLGDKTLTVTLLNGRVTTKWPTVFILLNENSQACF